MSDNLEVEQDDDTDLVRQLRQQLKETNKRVKSAEDGLAAANKILGERSLNDILSAKKINAKVAKFILADGVDATDEEAVNTWLTENADVFGFTAETPEDEAGQEQREAMQQIQQVANHAAPAVPGDLSAALAALPDDADPDLVAATVAQTLAPTG